MTIQSQREWKTVARAGNGKKLCFSVVWSKAVFLNPVTDVLEILLEILKIIAILLIGLKSRMSSA